MLTALVSKVWLGKALAPIFVSGPLVQVPSEFLLKSLHVILALSAALALVTLVFGAFAELTGNAAHQKSTTQQAYGTEAYFAGAPMGAERPGSPQRVRALN
jgi:hypothetical protein